jgi:hypothetical protein
VRSNLLKFAVVTSSSSPQNLAVPAGSVTEETVTKQQATVPFQPPASLSTPDLVWILRTGRWRQWPTVTARFCDGTWDVAVALLRSGGILVKCEVTRDRTFVPLRLRLTEAWASGATDHIRQLTNTPEPTTAWSALLGEPRATPELDAELALLTGMPDDDRLRALDRPAS